MYKKSVLCILKGPFQNGLDWVIGSTRTEAVTYTYSAYTCGPGGEVKSTMNVPDYNPNDPCWATLTGTYNVLVPTPSDGVIPQESAWSLPGVGAARYRALNVNHEQLKNSTEMQRIYQDIFDGIKRPSDNSGFFIVPSRP